MKGMKNSIFVFQILASGRPLTRSFRARSFIVPKFKWFNRRCHNHDLDLEALDSKHIGEDFIISSIDIVYKLVLDYPLMRAFGTPQCVLKEVWENGITSVRDKLDRSIGWIHCSMLKLVWELRSQLFLVLSSRTKLSVLGSRFLGAKVCQYSQRSISEVMYNRACYDWT
ncbi:hypothetical protein Tco_0139273 [Tanacetum coccineum]